MKDSRAEEERSVFDRKFRQTDDLNPEAKKILENNQLLHVYEGLVKRGKRFINKAIRINQKGEPFTHLNFKEFRTNTYKQYVFQLRHAGLVEKIMVSECGYYRVKGFKLSSQWENITSQAMGVCITNHESIQHKVHQTYEWLQEYFDELEPPALHNIRLHFFADYLYEFLDCLYKKGKSYGIQYIPKNKSFILVPNVNWEHNCGAKIIVTPKNLVQVMIKNTLSPLAYDENGVYELLSKLGDIRRQLTDYLPDSFNKIPPITEWLFVRADFGRDCKKPLGRIFPEMQLRAVAGALVRIYAKSWPDGKRRLRLEKIITPNRPIHELLNTEKMTISKIAEI